jgi:hypothetical protein
MPFGRAAAASDLLCKEGGLKSRMLCKLAIGGVRLWPSPKSPDKNIGSINRKCLFFQYRPFLSVSLSLSSCAFSLIRFYSFLFEVEENTRLSVVILTCGEMSVELNHFQQMS